MSSPKRQIAELDSVLDFIGRASGLELHFAQWYPPTFARADAHGRVCSFFIAV